MSIDPGAARVYGRFEDDRDSRSGVRHRLRKTTVYAARADRSTLTIATVDSKYNAEYRPTRLTVEQARDLRDAIGRFLEDQGRPDAEPEPDADPDATLELPAGADVLGVDDTPRVVSSYEEFSKL